MTNDDDEPILGFQDAYEIGEKVVEMADRVKNLDKIMPGAVAKWGFELDGSQFEVTVRCGKTIERSER